jgi:putative DNA primase/helicase
MFKEQGSSPVQRCLERLSGVKESGEGWRALCPAHEDHRPSLGVAVGRDGRALLFCQAGCSLGAICNAIGLSVADLFPDRKIPVSTSSTKVKYYFYLDQEGKPLFKIKRTKDKEFYPYVYDADKESYSTKAGWFEAERVPYKLDDIVMLPKNPIFWVEGEKDADHLTSLGLLATTSPGGSQAYRTELARYFKDRDVILVPDNDKPGRKYMRAVAKSLENVASSVKWLELPGLPQSGDVSDFFEAGGTKEAFLEYAESASDWQQVHDLRVVESPPLEEKKGKPGHGDLRDRWREKYPNVAYGRGEWQEYSDSHWAPVEDIAIEAQVIGVIEGARYDGVNLTSSLLSSVLRLGRAAAYVPRDRWDADPDLLVCGNGTLKLSTRELRESRPGDYITSRLPYDYDPGARCEVFERVLELAIPDAVDFLQEFAGYCLTPDTQHETALWFKGPRGSGKSSVIEGLVAMLGARHGILGLGEIESSPFALSRIPGKTLLTSTEQPSSYLKSTHVIDALISGETLTIERKYRDSEEVTPVAKVVWAMNELPRIGNTTAGIFRRVKIVEFPPLKKERRPEVKECIKAEGAGILNWALDGLGRLQERGEFIFPESVKDATAEFEYSNDLPAQFVEEKCVTGEGKDVSASLLYSNYSDWCKGNGHKPVSSTRLAEDWVRLGFWKRKSMGRNFWCGLELRGGNDL